MFRNPIVPMRRAVPQNPQKHFLSRIRPNAAIEERRQQLAASSELFDRPTQRDVISTEQRSICRHSGRGTRRSLAFSQFAAALCVVEVTKPILENRPPCQASVARASQRLTRI